VFPKYQNDVMPLTAPQGLDKVTKKFVNTKILLAWNGAMSSTMIHKAIIKSSKEKVVL